MTDSNHAPLTERERLAGKVAEAVELAMWDENSSESIARAAIDAILADPTYARAAEMREALRECVRSFDCDWPAIRRARALLDEGKT